MSVDNVASLYGATSVSSSSSSINDQFLDPNLFMKLLMTQMQYQDPLSGGSDPTAQMSQMANFALIEQMNQLASVTEQNMMLNVMSQSSDMIGKNVKVDLGEDGTVEGKVDKVIVKGGMPLIVIGEKEYSIYQVVEVNAGGTNE